MVSKLWQDWVLLACAAWLFISPFVLGYASGPAAAAWAAWIASVVLFISAAEALVIPDALEEWVDFVVGLGLVASPWLLGYSGEIVPAANSVVTGVVVATVAILALSRDLREGAPGHHWSAH